MASKGHTRTPTRFAPNVSRVYAVPTARDRGSRAVHIGLAVFPSGSSLEPADAEKALVLGVLGRIGQVFKATPNHVDACWVEYDDRNEAEASEHALSRLAEALPVGVVQVDARGNVVFTNERLHALLATPRAVTVVEQFAAAATDDRRMVAEVFDVVLRSGLDDDVVVRLSDTRRLSVSVRALTKGTNVITGAIACVTDISAGTHNQDPRLKVKIDEVTRCHDRASTLTSLEMAMRSGGDTNRPGVIVVDLDHFDAVNERFGRDAGDELLGVVAKRLLGAVRSHDIVGRIGEDEFLIICTEVHTAAQAMRTALRIGESLRHQFKLKCGQVACHSSIGVAMASEGESKAASLVRRAQSAMAESKQQGAGRPVLGAPPQSDAPTSSSSSTS